MRDNRTLDLFGPLGSPRDEMGEDERRFWSYHERSPQVYFWVCDYIDKLIRAGHTRCSIWLVIGAVRAESAINEHRYRISNNLFAYYARLWLRDHPERPGFFTIKSLKSALSSRFEGLE